VVGKALIIDLYRKIMSKAFQQRIRKVREMDVRIWTGFM
jgi:hypothetical protein